MSVKDFKVRSTIFQNGRKFGDIGAYERLAGIVEFEIDPDIVCNSVITDIKNKVMFLSRLKLPLELKAEYKRHLKHLSIISFKPDALKKFYKSKKTPLETAEDIELLRALEIGLTIKSVVLEGDSFSVDVEEDYKKAKANINLNKFFKLYK